MDTEGVIKFGLDFTAGAPIPMDTITALNAWRTVLFRLRLIGRDPMRYGGLGYGNVSQRIDRRRFVISGTQTGNEEFLCATDYCTVEDYDIHANLIRASGTIKPSSETLTHAAIYAAAADARCVMHIHSPEIWQNADRLKLIHTPESAAYGSPELALALSRMAMTSNGRIVAMKGHEDGIIAFGESPAAVAWGLIDTLAVALGLTNDQATAGNSTHTAGS